jgi:hypothetical protein
VFPLTFDEKDESKWHPSLTKNRMTLEQDNFNFTPDDHMYVLNKIMNCHNELDELKENDDMFTIAEENEEDDIEALSSLTLENVKVHIQYYG